MEFKNRIPKIPRLAPSLPENLAQKFAQPSTAFCRQSPDQFPPRRLMLAKISRLDYCILKQYLIGTTVDPYEIEDTSDWLGCPTRLETVKHYASMLEEDIQVLRLQLRAAKENISCLVEINAQLTAELQKNRVWMANLEAETTNQLLQILILTLVLDQKTRIILELQAGNGCRSSKETT